MRLFRANGTRATLIQADGMVASVMPATAASSRFEQGMLLDSRLAPLVAGLDEPPFDEAPERQRPELATVGRVKDVAYGYPEPKLGPAIAALPGRALHERLGFADVGSLHLYEERSG